MARDSCLIGFGAAFVGAGDSLIDGKWFAALIFAAATLFFWYEASDTDRNPEGEKP